MSPISDIGSKVFTDSGGSRLHNDDLVLTKSCCTLKSELFLQGMEPNGLSGSSTGELYKRLSCTGAERKRSILLAMPISLSLNYVEKFNSNWLFGYLANYSLLLCLESSGQQHLEPRKTLGQFSQAEWLFQGVYSQRETQERDTSELELGERT